MNTPKLKAAIFESGYANRYIAKQVGISAQQFSKKLNGHVEFKVSEVHKLCNLLNIASDTMMEIFFNDEVV